MLAERRCGTAEGQHLVYGSCEAMSWTRRIIGRDDLLDPRHQAVDLYMCPETAHGIRRSVVFQLGVWVGMQEEARINQEAQDHAMACARFAGLRGQLTPSCMRLPVLHKHLDEPTPGVGLDTIERAPRQGRRAPIAIARFACVVQRQDHACGVVGAAVYSRPGHDGHDRFPAAEAEVLRRTRMGRHIVGHVRRAFVRAHVRLAASL
jgi:hypothetical protein